MKKIPIGIDDFKTILSDNYFYIDKTKFIEEVFDDGAIVKLFTRPRRFGKSLNMSMLRYFFDIKDREENRKLFNGLYIENSPVFVEQGKYPVIFISMKEVKGNSWEECLKNLKELMKDLYSENLFVRDSLNIIEQRDFDKIAFMEENGNFQGALKYLTKYLCDYYNEKVIVLIDEYDIPLISAYEYGYYDEAVSFFKGLYGSVLKSNNNLKMGVLTGAIRVAQAGIFSDLNNLKVNTILNKAYDEYFGLTESEVKKTLKDYNIEHKIDEVKSWYDGYKFGDAEVYNPWSILNYLDEKELKAYWINTSGNALIRELLLVSDKKVFDDLEDLVNGQEKNVYISESVVLGNNLAPNSFWELMLFSGYLTIKEKINPKAYLVRIPNKEVKTFFKDLFVDIVFKGTTNVMNMVEALEKKNIGRIISILEEVVLNAMSFHDTSIKYENPYQTLLAGFFYALDSYYLMSSNIESGYGRADIILNPRNKTWAGYIFELKRAKTDNLEKEAQEAFNQIDDKKYDTMLKRNGVKDVVKIGLVFDGKKIEFNYFN